MIDDLDRVLSNEPEIRPSRAFVASVMNAVEREAAPPPIAFPWLRATPLMAAPLVLAALVVINAPSLDAGAWSSSGAAAAAEEWLRAASTPAMIWTVVALLVSAASAAAAMVRVER
jgi:hypothetical protein